eukprot:UN03706
MHLEVISPGCSSQGVTLFNIKSRNWGYTIWQSGCFRVSYQIIKFISVFFIVISLRQRESLGLIISRDHSNGFKFLQVSKRSRKLNLIFAMSSH